MQDNDGAGLASTHGGSPAHRMVTDRIGFSLMGRVTERRRTLRIRDGAVSSRADTLVAEEPWRSG